MTDENEKTAPRKPGCLVVASVLLLLAGLAVGALHYFGKLQPLLDRVRQTTPATPPPTAAVPDVTEPVEPATEIVPAPVQTQAPPAKIQESATAAAYRARFKPPKIGSAMNLALANGQKIAGALAGLDENCVRIGAQNVIITLDRAQLAPVSLAACYEDEYVKYMVALRSRPAEKQQGDSALLKTRQKRVAEYEAERRAAGREY